MIHKQLNNIEAKFSNIRVKWGLVSMMWVKNEYELREAHSQNYISNSLNYENF